MQATEKKMNNKIWLSILSVGVVIALVLGIVALVNHGDTKANAIPTINQQVDNIKNTLPELEKVSTELKGYIDTLETTVEKLQTDLTATNTAIDTLKKDLGDDIDENEQALLDKLTELKTTIEGQLTAITTSLQTLAKNDEQLGKHITDLKTYVDTGLQGNKDWANATFSTLEQYEATQTTISEIKALIKNNQDSIVTLETKLNKKIADDIATAVAGVNANIATKVTEITNAYTAAIGTAKTELEGKIAAVEAAIKTSETSMKQWVNELLADGYYTKAEIDGKITALQTHVAEGDAELQKEIDDLKAALAKAEADFTAAYEKAINDAITNNNGKINAEIAAAVKTAQDNLQGQIDAIISEIEKINARLDIIEADINSINQQIDYINGNIDDLKRVDGDLKAYIDALQTIIDELKASDAASKAQIEALEDLVAELQAKLDAANNRIQSVEFVPDYTDGKVLMDYATRTTRVHFRISPASMAKLISVRQVEAFVIYTDDPTNRDGGGRAIAPEFPLAVESVTGQENGMLELILKEDSENLFDNDFWTGAHEAVIYIVITDDNGNKIASDTVPMIAHAYGSIEGIRIYEFGDGNTYTGEVTE